MKEILSKWFENIGLRNIGLTRNYLDKIGLI